MKSLGKKVGVFCGVAAVFCIVIGLMVFLQSDGSVSGEPITSGSDSPELKPQASSVVTQAAKPAREKSVKVHDSSGKEKPREVDVFGVIRDKKGKLVASASVHALQAGSGAKRYDATSSTLEDGTYSLTGLHIHNPFPYKIIASAPGHAPTSPQPFIFDRAPREINITLSRGASLSGRVKSAAGESIEGATLSLVETSTADPYWVYFYTDFDNVLSSTTNAGGDYLFPHAPPGEYWLYVRARNYFDTDKLVTIFPRDTDLTCNFALDYAGDEHIAGVVIDEQDGRPIEGARVNCRDDSISKSGIRRIRRACYTSADGRFLIEGLQGRPQIPHIDVIMHGYRRKDVQTHGRDRHTLDRHDLKVTLQSDTFGTASGNVVGRIFDGSSTKPISKFTIAVLRKEGEVFFWGDRTYCAYSQEFNSPEGSFFVGDLANGRVSLLVSAAGYATRLVPAVAYPEDFPEDRRAVVEIGLEPGVTATGTVHDLRSGDPLAGVRVNLDYDWQSSDIGPISSSVFTDELGRYRLEGVPEDAQWLIASHPGYAPAFSGEIQFSKGEVRSGLDFTLASGGTVEGRVLDEFREQEGITITFQPIDSPVLLQKVRRSSSFENRFLGPPRTAQTDEQGRYRIEGLSPGHCLVRTYFWASDGDKEWPVDVREVIETREGKSTVFDIPVCGGTIKGIILFDDSFRVDMKKGDGYYAYLREADAPPFDLNSKADQVMRPPLRDTMNSRFGENWGLEFSGVCPGEYTVTVLRYERTPNRYQEFVDQRSVPVSVRRMYGITSAAIDFRKGVVASWSAFGSKLFQSLFGGDGSDTGQADP